VNVLCKASLSFSSVYFSSEVLLLLNYAVAMIGALQSKNLSQANMGHKLALVSFCLLIVDNVIDSFTIVRM